VPVVSSVVAAITDAALTEPHLFDQPFKYGAFGLDDEVRGSRIALNPGVQANAPQRSFEGRYVVERQELAPVTGPRVFSDDHNSVSDVHGFPLSAHNRAAIVSGSIFNADHQANSSPT
jgi:hypothetical protein